MPYNKLKIFLILSVFPLLWGGLGWGSVFSQNAFDKMLDMDSIYRYNTSLKTIDSLFSNIPKKTTDTSFTNPFGKAEVITLDQMIYFARMKNPDLGSMQYKIDAIRTFGKTKSYLPDPLCSR